MYLNGTDEQTVWVPDEVSTKESFEEQYERLTPEQKEYIKGILTTLEIMEGISFESLDETK